MRLLILLFLVSIGCVDQTPCTPTPMTCGGWFVCYGDHFGLYEVESLEAARAEVGELAVEAKCQGAPSEVVIICHEER